MVHLDLQKKIYKQNSRMPRKRRMNEYTSQTTKYCPMMPSGDTWLQKQYAEAP